MKGKKIISEAGLLSRNSPITENTKNGGHYQKDYKRISFRGLVRAGLKGKGAVCL
jgi:hypothetical protein